MLVNVMCLHIVHVVHIKTNFKIAMTSLNLRYINYKHCSAWLHVRTLCGCSHPSCLCIYIDCASFFGNIFTKYTITTTFKGCKNGMG